MSTKKSKSKIKTSPRKLPILKSSLQTAVAIKKDPSLALYMKELAKYPLLDKKTEMQISKKYFETKNPQLGQVLLQANLRFVVRIALEYTKFGAQLMDLIQEGNLGLLEAIKRFNPYKGVRIITYAVWWVRGYIQEYLMKDYSMVRIGTNAEQKKLFYLMQKHKEKLDALKSPKALEAFAKDVGSSTKNVTLMRDRLSGKDLSLDVTVGPQKQTSLLDFQKSNSEEEPDKLLEEKQNLNILKQNLKEVEAELNDKEKYILKERLLKNPPQTLQSIGEHFHLTREAIRLIENKLLDKIKQKMKPYQS